MLSERMRKRERVGTVAVGGLETGVGVLATAPWLSYAGSDLGRTAYDGLVSTGLTTKGSLVDVLNNFHHAGPATEGMPLGLKIGLDALVVLMDLGIAYYAYKWLIKDGVQRVARGFKGYKKTQ